jgi:pimeloyl-ACP methyl ester carboxylesterase
MAKQFQLPDGRNLDYAVYGPADWFPLIWIHGTPGGYIPVPDVRVTCEKKGLRLITVSRAGYGDSTRNKGRKIVDAVADLHALNEYLGVKECLVGGWSGGGMLHLLKECLMTRANPQNRPPCFGFCGSITRLRRRALRCGCSSL